MRASGWRKQSAQQQNEKRAEGDLGAFFFGALQIGLRR
jgi:hypothetical protein